MKKSDLNLTPDQLMVYLALQRARMGWITLIVLLLLLTVGFVSFLVAVFKVPEQTASKSIAGGIDLLLGWALKIVVTSLFPSQNKDGSSSPH